MGDRLKSVVFIGAGHVATSLAEALNGKRKVVQVYSKTLTHAKILGQKLKCSYTNDLKKILSGADLYIIAVKDDAIEDVCKKLRLPGKLIVHTSGSTEINLLKSVSNKNGVIWPMYSFGDKTRLLPKVPFFIEASDKETEKELSAVVRELKGIPYYLNSEKRAIIHLTAVFVNNFPNHLFAIAETLCAKAGIPFKLFLPFAKETVNLISHKSPRLNQTGPASRNDQRIIKKHLALLSADKLHPLYKEVYKTLTKSIIQTTHAGRKKL